MSHESRRVRPASPRFVTCGLLLIAILDQALGLRTLAAAEDSKLNFEDDIAPILEARCSKCHAAEGRKGGLDLRRRSKIAEGGDSGAALVPGKPDESLLVTRVKAGEMPPEGEDKLDAKQIELLARWVAEGAAVKATDGSEPPLDDEGTDVEVSDADRDFWAFKPPVRPGIPALADGTRLRTPVDSFLLAKLQAQGAAFSDDASPRVVIRRLYFDLLGLPPSPEEIAAFESDQRPDAYERLVDRLLASPRYGERFARHWLDVAGYADSDGYLDADRLRPEAWRYRDYVIRALNDDKPYDRFVLEQIAGDELADWRRAGELTPELRDNLVATGFMRTALDATYDNWHEPVECHKVMADTIEIVSSTFLGLTVQCARCHAHKFDPISQRDYYRLHAVLLASYDPQEWQVSLARSIPLASEVEQQRITEQNQQADARIGQLNAHLAELAVRYRDRLLDEALAGISDEALRQQVRAALVVPDPNQRSEEQKKLVADHAATVDFSEAALTAKYPEFAAELARLRAAVAAEQALKKDIVRLRGLFDLDDQPRQAHVLVRGDFNTPGKPVEPGVPAVLAAPGYEFQPQPGYKTTGRRLAFAQWLVDPRHPLTARVQVNRAWSQLFDVGLVETAANFGKAGSPPTNAELLDWLARDFADGGWSQKNLHRAIVTSTAYRQSSRPTLSAQGGATSLLAAFPPKRLDGETVRDTILQLSGGWNAAMFGPPAAVVRHGDGMVTVAEGPDAGRASIYLIVRRSQHVTLLDLLDVPKMEVNCTERRESFVVTQSLALLNSGFMEQAATAFAARLQRDVPADEPARLRRAWELAYGRAPGGQEEATLLAFLDGVGAAELQKPLEQAAPAEYEAARAKAWTQLALVLFNSNEFLFVP